MEKEGRKLKFLHILGCRPHIIKYTNIQDDDVIVWTSQHYNDELASSLLEEFNIDPTYKITPNESFGKVINSIKQIIDEVNPTHVIVYGDTRTTLAGAVASLESKTSLVHIESGIRTSSYLRYEEKVRRAVDHMADILFAPTELAEENLIFENVRGKIFMVGDVHYDEYIKRRANNGRILATFHRQEHVDTKEGLMKVLNLLKDTNKPVDFPLHPRTEKNIDVFGISVPDNINILPSLPYKDLMNLVKKAYCVITDSGGLSKEAQFNGTPVSLYGIDEWPQINSFGIGNSKETIKAILLEGKDAKWNY